MLKAIQLQLKTKTQDTKLITDYHNRLAKLTDQRNVYMKLIQSSSITYEQAESYLMHLNKQEMAIKLELENLRMQSELQLTYNEEIKYLKALLIQAKNHLYKIENEMPEYESRLAKQDIIKLLVLEIIVETLPSKASKKQNKREYQIHLKMRLGMHTNFGEAFRGEFGFVKSGSSQDAEKKFAAVKEFMRG
jgi:hypothetical protein